MAEYLTVRSAIRTTSLIPLFTLIWS